MPDKPKPKPRYDHTCRKCYLPVTWDATRNVWVTRTGAAGCKNGGRHEAVR